MSNPSDPPNEEDRLRPGMPTSTGGGATASSAGGAAAAATGAGASDEAAGRYMIIRNVFLHRHSVRNTFGVKLKSPDKKERTNAIGCLVETVHSFCSAPEGLILSEDQLVSINGKPIVDWTYHEIMSYIKDLKSDTLVLSLRRELPKPAKATKATGASGAAAAASSAGGGATGAAGAAVAAGTSDVPDGDPQLDQPGGTATAAAATAACSPDCDTSRPRRTPSRGTISYQEEFQKPSTTHCRGSHKKRWEKNLAELRKFKEKHGHCNVPQKYPSNPALSEFVQYVRAKRDSLSDDRLEVLEELEFVFLSHEAAWNFNFRGVKDFFRKAGGSGTIMSALRSEKPALYGWVKNQREAYANFRRGRGSTMTEDRILHLEEIGIDSDPSGKFTEESGDGGDRRKSKKVCIPLFFFSFLIFSTMISKFVLHVCTCMRACSA